VGAVGVDATGGGTPHIVVAELMEAHDAFAEGGLGVPPVTPPEAMFCPAPEQPTTRTLAVTQRAIKGNKRFIYRSFTMARREY
jgi:hypothetical protein